MDANGRSAIVTGGALRIGRSIALALAERGINVCVHYGTSEAEARSTLEAIRELGAGAVAVAADLTDAVTAAKSIVSAAKSAFGRVDILVNSAAIFEAATLAETDEDHFDRHVAINLKAPLFLCRAFAEQLPDDARGHILNLVDWRALRPPVGHLTYTATKSGLASLTRMLALELAPRIQVNGIAPGAILPPPGGDRETWLQNKLPAIPLGRVGSTDEIVRAALFLLESDFVTGEILHVTGGEHLQV